MDEEKKERNAQKAYETICNTLDDMEYHYIRDDENLRVDFIVHGGSLPMEIIMQVYAEREYVKLITTPMFSTPKEKRLDMAIAICLANFGLMYGKFEFLFNEEGFVRYHMPASLHGCILSKEYFHFMIVGATSIIDKYGERLLLLSRGKMDLQEFAELEKTTK